MFLNKALKVRVSSLHVLTVNVFQKGIVPLVHTFNREHKAIFSWQKFLVKHSTLLAQKDSESNRAPGGLLRWALNTILIFWVLHKVVHKSHRNIHIRIGWRIDWRIIDLSRTRHVVQEGQLLKRTVLIEAQRSHHGIFVSSYFELFFGLHYSFP